MASVRRCHCGGGGGGENTPGRLVSVVVDGGAIDVGGCTGVDDVGLDGAGAGVGVADGAGGGSGVARCCCAGVMLAE